MIYLKQVNFMIHKLYLSKNSHIGENTSYKTCYSSLLFMATLGSEIHHHIQRLQRLLIGFCVISVTILHLNLTMQSSHKVIPSSIPKLTEHAQKYPEISTALNLAFRIHDLPLFLQLNNKSSATILQVFYGPCNKTTYSKLQDFLTSLFLIQCVLPLLIVCRKPSQYLRFPSSFISFKSSLLFF